MYVCRTLYRCVWYLSFVSVCPLPLPHCRRKLQTVLKYWPMEIPSLQVLQQTLPQSCNKVENVFFSMDCWLTWNMFKVARFKQVLLDCAVRRWCCTPCTMLYCYSCTEIQITSKKSHTMANEEMWCICHAGLSCDCHVTAMWPIALPTCLTSTPLAYQCMLCTYSGLWKRGNDQ